MSKKVCLVEMLNCIFFNVVDLLSLLKPNKIMEIVRTFFSECCMLGR